MAEQLQIFFVDLSPALLAPVSSGDVKITSRINTSTRNANIAKTKIQNTVAGDPLCPNKTDSGQISIVGRKNLNKNPHLLPFTANRDAFARITCHTHFSLANHAIFANLAVTQTNSPLTRLSENLREQ